MNIKLILDIAMWVSVAVVVFVGAFAAKIQATTLWAGKKIAPEGMESELPTGFQDAITPKIQDTFNTLLPICYIAILVAGSIKAWYLGILLLIAAFVGMSVLKVFLSNRMKFYLKIINFYMINKTADYAKAGDEMRVEAAKDVSDQLLQLYFNIPEDFTIPDFSEIKKMPLG